MLEKEIHSLILEFWDLLEDLLVYLFGICIHSLGISDAQLGISEIGVGYPDSTFGEESRIGVPFIVRFFYNLHTDLQVYFKRNSPI